MGALNRWVYRVFDGLLVMGEGADPSVYLSDQVNYALVDLPDDAPIPTPRTQRAASATTLRAATAPEIAAYDASQLSARSQATSRQKDILAMLATVVRGRNVATWNALTGAQKVAAVLAEADVFKAMRDFIDDKV